ncbi:MAG: hypothetical protein ACRCT2_08825, partial [Plesiomonas shigelloides]
MALEIQQSYKQGAVVALSLRELENRMPARPRMRAPTEDADEAALAIEAIENLEEFRSLTTLYNKRVEQYDDNMTKAYALIYDKYCTKTMRDRIDEKVATDADITNDPIRLLTTIRALMQEPIKDQNPGWSMEQLVIKALSIRQADNESMSDYAKRFKQNSAHLRQLIGTRWTDHWTETTEEYLTLVPGDDLLERQEALKASMVSRNSAIRLIKGACHAKYGSLVTVLNTQYNLKNNQWPSTVVEAVKLLSSHMLDTKGHAKQDPLVTRGATFAQLPRDVTKLICYCCGKTGHIVPDCSDRLIIPPEKWYRPKGAKKVLSQTAEAAGADTDTEQEQTESEVEPSSEEDTRTTRRRSATPAPARKRSSRSRRGGPSRDDDGWAALQYEDPLGPMWTPSSFAVMSQSKAPPVDSKWSTLLNNTILLDTGSTISGTMMNPDFVTDIRPATKPITMSTNAGTKRLTMSGCVPGFGSVYYDPEQMANIFGFSHMADQYRITYDSAVEDAFVVHMAHRPIKFHRTHEGLYVYTPDDSFKDRVAAHKHMLRCLPSPRPTAGIHATVHHASHTGSDGGYDSDSSDAPGLDGLDDDGLDGLDEDDISLPGLEVPNEWNSRGGTLSAMHPGFQFSQLAKGYDSHDSDTDDDADDAPGLVPRTCDSDSDDDSYEDLPGLARQKRKRSTPSPITWKRNRSFMVATVKENREGFTTRQFERAKAARTFYHSVGCPTTANFKLIIRQNIIKDCPVTVDDVDLAERIFGPDIGALKGKSTRRKPVPVRDDNVAIPPELLVPHKDLTLCMDVMYVNGLPLFTCIDQSIKFRSVVPLKTRTSRDLFSALDTVFRVYNAAGMTITMVHCDQEFKHHMDMIYDQLSIHMNYTTTGDHVPEAERNNRTLKERIRAAFHNLPFRSLPRIVLKHLILGCCHQLNIFPAKTGISAYFSPYALVLGRNLPYKQYSIPFGSYVQASHEALDYNTMEPRTIGCLHLGHVPSVQGGHHLLHLNTGLLTTRPRATVIPITDDVIARVEELAAADGMKGLKFADRNRISY